MKLKLNETVELDVYANKEWNSTAIEISKDQEYEFTASGNWTDFLIKTDADGYSNMYMRLFNSMKRAKNENWFALIGSLNKQNNSFFLMGKYNKITFNSAGIFHCFANDVPGFYFNNFGSISLKINRLK